MAKPGHEEGKADWPREEAKPPLAKGGEGRSRQVSMPRGGRLVPHTLGTGKAVPPAKESWAGTASMRTKGQCLHSRVLSARRQSPSGP